MTANLSLGQLIESNRGRAVSYALTIVGNQDEAEDAVQDAAVRAIECAKPEHSDPHIFAGWWLCLVVSAARNRRRALTRRPTVSLDSIDDASLQSPSSDSPEASLLGHELSQDLATAIRALPADQRQDFLAWADRASSPAGADGALSPAHRQRLHRIRQKLRDMIPDPRVPSP